LVVEGAGVAGERQKLNAEAAEGVGEDAKDFNDKANEAGETPALLWRACPAHPIAAR